ncbi:MAG: ATP-binding protein [Chloroflexi bacterium]|nr:ATP-binding protein [Chloroflexota bacterium]
MEHIGDILKKMRTNISSSDMDTWSSDETETPGAPECPVCKGAGVVHPRLASGKPDFSRTVPCNCVREQVEQKRRDWLQRYSNLGQLTRLTFDNLVPQGRSGNPAHQRQFAGAFEAARVFAAGPKGWFVLSGPSGCGKTHLAAAIANYRLALDQPVFYISVPDLLDHLKASFSPTSDIPYDEFFDQVRNVSLLVLDDLGVQSSTPWAREKLDQLLTYRFNAELPTVVVTIVPVPQLDDRLQTRLSDPRTSQLHVIEEEQTASLYGWGPEFELQKTMTFSNFDLRVKEEYRDNLEAVYHLAMSFARSPDGWLVLQGVNGCGKTHLAAAICNFRYQANQPALFVVVVEFLDHLKATFSPGSKVGYDQLFESVKTAPLLVLDDFGEQSGTPWAREKMYQVVNYRYNARLPTVITTTYTLDADEIEGRIASRLIDHKLSTFFNITAPDYRGDLRPQERRRVRRRG